VRNESLRSGPPPVSTTPTTTPAIELAGIAQRLGTRWALRGVDLTVEPGELVAVVGHNGSGKTTLLRVVATALRPTRGSGRVFGHDLKADADGVRSNSSLLTFATGLYDDLTAAENLDFAMRMAGQKPDRRTVEQALERVGLRADIHGRVRTFSSGMQRRVALARLYLRPARLLLLDEPYNSLDAGGVQLIDDLLVDARQRGGAALVVLHDLERGRAMFDRVIELREGKVVEETIGCRPDAARAFDLGAVRGGQSAARQAAMAGGS
jgi:heme exporter protein A